MLLTVLIAFFCAGYGLLMLWLIWGWLKMPESGITGAQDSAYFSVLVPARNEESNICDCLMDLINQEFSRQQFEIIVIDDHSEDRTPQLVEEVIQEFGSQVELRLIKSAASQEDQNFVAYKKKALETGIAQAKGDWVVTTDADCFRGKYWLRSLSDFIGANEPYMVSGPVMFRPCSNFFERLQALEFMGLIGIGGASMSNGKPNMCNGANLAYRKDRFQEAGGFSGVDHLASGDDEFLMHKMASQYPGKVQFLKSQEAIVYTAPQNGIGAFLAQRKRWASKSRQYSRLSVSAVVFFVFGFHLLLIASAILATAGWIPAWMPLSLGGSKFGAEFLFLLILSRFFGNKGLLPYYLPAAVIYPFYVVFIGIYGNLGGYEWKDRRLQ